VNKKGELITWASSKIGKPFIWGESDCTTLSLEGINIYYGNIFNIENTWNSFKEALRAFKKYGTPMDILTKEGFTIVTKKYEQTGDIFVWQGKGYFLIGIVINQSVLVADEGKLLSLRPISSFDSYFCYHKEI
jgi:hypothetical protein